MELTKKLQFKRKKYVPESWIVTPLNEITTEIGDGIHTTPKYVDHSEYYFINGNNLNNGQILFNENTKFVSKSEHQKLKKKLNKNTILMSINGTIGKLAFYNNEKIVLGKSAAYISINPEINKHFLYYLLQSTAIKEYFENELTGSTIRNLSLESIRNAPVPLPPKNEQRAIAEVLSDVDAMIEAQEALIEKKRLIKQGVMQELLTGKRRLPGFSGEWEKLKIGDIARINRGTSKSKFLNENGKYFLVDMGAISQDGQLIVTKRTNYSKDFLSKGNLVMPSDDIGGGKIIGKTAYIPEDKKYIFGDHIHILDIIKGNPLFISYMINSHSVNKEVKEKVSGSAQLGLSKSSVEEQSIFFPEIEEQKKIATVIKDLENEIVSHKEILDKYSSIKIGIMQELLTGRTRLV
jgi:type I restriction enzyme, S subunit